MEASRRVLIIEDDKTQADLLKHEIEKHIGLTSDIISTELEFWNRYEKMNHQIAVVDMMLRWTDPAPDMQMPPAHIIKEGFFTAGLRCCRALRKKNIPCVVFTALDPARIPLSSPDEFEIINKSQGYGA